MGLSVVANPVNPWKWSKPDPHNIFRTITAACPPVERHNGLWQVWTICRVGPDAFDGCLDHRDVGI